MKINTICTMWGQDQSQVDVALLQRVKDAGFSGIEIGAPADPVLRNELKSALKDYDLVMVGQQWSEGGNFGGAKEHIASFEKQFHINVDAGAIFVNSHTGKDHFTLETNLKIISEAERIAEGCGVDLYHETHRARWTFSLPQTMAILSELTELKLTADFSHWCCVHESMLGDQLASLDIAIKHSHYIHARVGHTQSPQITDPRVEAWSSELETHLSWWGKIIEHRKSLGWSEIYICPEFGPYPYMTHAPQNDQPLVSQWDVNCFMSNLLKERFSD